MFYDYLLEDGKSPEEAQKVMADRGITLPKTLVQTASDTSDPDKETHKAYNALKKTEKKLEAQKIANRNSKVTA